MVNGHNYYRNPWIFYNNCGIKEMYEWLNTDNDNPGYQIMTDEDIIDIVNQ